MNLSKSQRVMKWSPTIEDVHHLIEKHRQVDVIFLDFAKAFDKVPHSRLLLKLSNYGIQGQVYNWIKDWLTNWHQRVIIDSKSSSLQPVLFGIPQGTVLGPLMFLIFINDITTGITSHICLFADDCIIYRPIISQNDHTIIRNDLETLATWARLWQMQLNIDKCYSTTH